MALVAWRTFKCKGAPGCLLRGALRWQSRTEVRQFPSKKECCFVAGCQMLTHKHWTVINAISEKWTLCQVLTNPRSGKDVVGQFEIDPLPGKAPRSLLSEQH